MSKKQILLSLFLVLLLSGSQALAQSGFDLSWWTADSGGTESSGGSYNLAGTIGQADAGRLSGGSYVLVGGFWGGSGPAVKPIYLPLVLKNS